MSQTQHSHRSATPEAAPARGIVAWVRWTVRLPAAPRTLAFVVAAGLTMAACSDDALITGALVTPDTDNELAGGDIAAVDVHLLDANDATADTADTSDDTGTVDGEPVDTENLDTSLPDTEFGDFDANDPVDVEVGVGVDVDVGIEDAIADVEPVDTEPADTPLDAGMTDAVDALDDATPVTPTCPECPTGYVCRVEGGPPRCVADPALACSPCLLDLSCAGGVCHAFASEASACLLPCPDPDGGCAPDQICQDFGSIKLCVPATNSCSCSSATAGSTKSCGGAGIGIGVCTGLSTCVPTADGWSPCTSVGASSETCNGLDDDCDGTTDEDLGAKSCGDDATLCPGLATCQGAAGYQCIAKAKASEVCNGVDDDCDGETDEGLADTPCGGTAQLCPGVRTCQGAQGWLCSAVLKAEESCNGLDDDCDGATDEGYLNAFGVPQSLQHCGACGTACPPPASLGTAVTCTDDGVAAACAWTCLAGWHDADGLGNTGCECKAQPGVDAPDGVDQDCDGVDGVAAAAVFVAKTGSDQNPGSRALPMRTLNAAQQRAILQGKPHLYVATGVYSENMRLVAGVSIYGGYAAGFGIHDPIAFQTVIAGTTVPSGVQAAILCEGIVGGAAGVATRVDGLTILGAAAQVAGAPSYGVWSVGCDDRFALVGCQVVAGNGGNGGTGGSGGGGNSGNKGNAGLPARDIGKAVCQQSDEQPGGLGGVSTCDVAANGGAGGTAICPVMDEDAPTPACPSKPYLQTAKPAETGSPGQTSIAASAGAAGWGGQPGWDSYMDSWLGQITACTNGPGCGTCRVPVEQRDGDDGGDGVIGVHGAGGAGCSQTKGVWSATGWFASSGGDGAAGGNGGGGGGGGAAGGVEVHDCDNHSSKFSDTGGSGGGGGAGGCGGGGGKGGGSGGASVAVGVIVGKGPAPLLIGNVLIGGNGGNGGSGGPGGGGGIGGKGGKGGAAVENKSETFCTSGGGDGGDAGDGGAGGGGGGGCGGPSAAVVLLAGAGTETALVDVDALTAFNQLVAGKAGNGGSGGPSIGGAGANGPAGSAAAILP